MVVRIYFLATLAALARGVASSIATSPIEPPMGSLSNDTRQDLLHTRSHILEWTLLVDGVMSQDACDTPERASCDETFWNGIFCSNPNTDIALSNIACSAIWRAQSPDGMLWRSPWEARAQNSSNPDFFSRDQGLATLASLTFTRNVSIFNSWLHYISDHDGFMCPKHWDCTLVTPFFCTFDKVAVALNTTRPDPKLMIPRLGEGACAYDHDYVLISCDVNEQGSALHLASLDVYIRRMIGDWSSTLAKAASRLHERDPENVFFEWLAVGASDSLARRLISQVPVWNTSSARSNRRQWSFVREDSEMAYKNSMGWEFVFMIDHLLATPEY